MSGAPVACCYTESPSLEAQQCANSHSLSSKEAVEGTLQRPESLLRRSSSSLLSPKGQLTKQPVWLLHLESS